MIIEFYLFFIRFIGKNDGITISVWNHRKIHKKQGSGFLGCIRILSNTIQRLKDTGCEYFTVYYIFRCIFFLKVYSKTIIFAFSSCILFIDQRLDLCKAHSDDADVVKGQIVVSLLSRDGHNGAVSNTVGHNAVVDVLGDLSCPTDLPDGWEERRAQNGRLYYVNHLNKSTQWVRPNSR